MKLVDSHCHIQSIDYSDRSDQTAYLWNKLGLSADEVVNRAHVAQVNKLICVGCDLNDSAAAIDFVKSRSGCFASVGIHPHEAEVFLGTDHAKEQLSSLISQPKVVAIGECGIDYFYKHSQPTDQKQVLRFQLEQAIQYNKPVIFHVREAFKDFWPIFDSYSNIRGVLHSFTDTSEELDQALSRGLFIGVNGIATFSKNADQLAMIKSIPNDRLLLETDSPYLTPTPYRGNINEPKHILTILEFMAELKGMASEELAKLTTTNTSSLFMI